jgi:non-canonical purine NTP pyrophosphatase (RdgB/HAM1 family)
MNVVFVTGNANKAKYFSELVGMEVEHHSADVDEVQSLDLEEIVRHKAEGAFKQLQRPVVVEDTSLVIRSMGRLPGPFIKWFLEEIGLEKVCRLADLSPDRSAVASSIYTYYDGNDMKHFNGSLNGTISDHPKGESGFGWNQIFIPEQSRKTLAEMVDEEFKASYMRIKMIKQVGEFLRALDNS